VERLANFLLGCDQQNGGTGTFRLVIEKRTLASLLGMTPENLSRAFGTLAKYGIVVNGQEVRIERPSDLIALACPNALIDDPQS
jgi:CRP/FNR family transcriptional activator FtrB